MKDSTRKMLNVLPLAVLAITVMVGFLWYTGRLALSFESLTTYSNPLLGISFRYPSAWKPDLKYGTVGDVSGRYEGDNGFFGVDALASNESISEIAEELANHKLKPYGQSPTILDLIADHQEARVIIPSKDQLSEPKEVALIVKYPEPILVRSNRYNYLLVVGDPSHIKVFADTLQFE